MRRFAQPALAALVVLVLAACTVDGGGGPPQPPANTIEVTANLNPNTSVSSVQLANGESQVFRIEVPSNVVSAGLFYIELDREVDLEVMTSGYGTVTYSSASRDYFGSGPSGLSATLAVAPQTVDTVVTCRGSCVIIEPANAGSVYARVTNRGSTTTVSLYAYGEAHGDTHEPGNDTLVGAPVFNLADSGAIETVGDVDYWYFDKTTTVHLDLPPVGIPIEVEVVDASGMPVPGSGGPFTDEGPIFVMQGEYLRVWALNEWQAASSARSVYYLSVEAP
jgi:hypothetical protein